MLFVFNKMWQEANEVIELIHQQMRGDNRGEVLSEVRMDVMVTFVVIGSGSASLTGGFVICDVLL